MIKNYLSHFLPVLLALDLIIPCINTQICVLFARCNQNIER